MTINNSQQILDKLDTIQDEMSAMNARMATKDDLKAFATKDDFADINSRMATKDDLKAFATKDDFADIREEQLRQSLLLEDLNTEMRTLNEVVSDGLQGKTRLDNHDVRLNNIEADVKLTKQVITHHTKQLKSLGAS